MDVNVALVNHVDKLVLDGGALLLLGFVYQGPWAVGGSIICGIIFLDRMVRGVPDHAVLVDAVAGLDIVLTGIKRKVLDGSGVAGMCPGG
eukprot:1049883-Prorocentrum_lima.AAC.1